MYKHTLTDVEVACGVTLEDVARELERGTIRENGSTFIVSADAPPALALSTARAAFGGSAEYIGKTVLGQAYRAASPISGC